MSVPAPRFLVAALAAVAAVAAGCGGFRPASAPALDHDGSPVVAVWTADTLSLAEFETAFRRSDGMIPDTAADPRARRVDFLERYVDFRLKVLAARAAGYDQDSSYLADLAGYRDQLAGPYFTDKRVLDDIVRDIYEKRAEEIEVAHVLFAVGENAPPADTLAAYREAEAVLDSVRSGLLTFEQAARRHSDDPSAAQNGGRLGYLTGGLTVLPFENAAYATPVGQIGGPVRTQFGVHLVKVSDRRPARTPIRASHILIRPTGSSPADTAAAVAEIEALRVRVLAGEDFAALARQYSQDPGSGANGGDLGVFGPGRMVPPFEEAAFALDAPGDLSGPVQTRFGIHLIQLTERQARPTYEAAYGEIRQQAERLPRTALKRQRIGQEFFESHGGTFDESVVREALAAFPADSVYYQIAVEGFDAETAQRPFATLGDATYRLGELQAAFRQYPTLTNEPAGIVDRARRYVYERAVEQAVAELETQDPEFAYVFRNYADGVLYFRAAEDSVWTRAKEDTAGLRAYFDARPGQFRYPERRRVLAFRAGADSTLADVVAALKMGASPAEAVRQIAGDADPAPVRLDTVYVSDSTGTDLDAVLGLDVGARTGTLRERGRPVVYQLDGIEPPREKTFEEARAELVSGFQEEVEAAWEARLRERYRARTFPERIPARPAPEPGSTGPAGTAR